MSRRAGGQYNSGGSSGSITLAGDATGPSGSNTVVAIQNIPVGSTLPSVGETLVFNGTSYEPGSPPAGNAYAFMDFQANGDLDTFPVDVPVDGQRPCVIASEFTVGRASLQTDGTSGTLVASLFKRTSPSSRVAIGTVSIAAGGGDNQVATVTLQGTQANRTFAVGDRCEMEFSDMMTGPVSGFSLAMRFEV